MNPFASPPTSAPTVCYDPEGAPCCAAQPAHAPLSWSPPLSSLLYCIEVGSFWAGIYNPPLSPLLPTYCPPPRRLPRRARPVSGRC